MKFYQKTKDDPTIYKDPEYTQPIGSEEEFKNLGGVPNWPASWKPKGIATNIDVGSPEFKPKIPDQIGVDVINEAITAPVDLPPDVLGPGEIISAPGSPDVFKFTGKGLQHIPDAEALEAEFGKEGWAKIKPVKQKTLDYWLGKKPATGELISPQGRPEIFKYEGVDKGMRWITDPGVFEGMEYKWEDVRDVLPEMIDSFKRGEPISELISKQMPYSDLMEYSQIETEKFTLEEQRDNYIKSITETLGGIGELREEERVKAYEEFDVKTSGDLLDQVNVEIAEKEKFWALREERAYSLTDSIGVVRGRAAQVRRQAAIEMGGLYSKQQALAGNYDRAIELADKSIGWAIEDERTKIEALKFTLDTIYDKLSSAEKKATDEFNYELMQRERELDQEENMKSWKRNVMVSYPLAGIEPTDSEAVISRKLKDIAEIQEIQAAEEWLIEKKGNTILRINDEDIDVSTVAGIKRAMELGYEHANWASLKAFLDTNAKLLSESSIEDLLSEAGLEPPAEPVDIREIEEGAMEMINDYSKIWMETADKGNIAEANKAHGTLEQLKSKIKIRFPELSDETIGQLIKTGPLQSEIQIPSATIPQRIKDKLIFWD